MIAIYKKELKSYFTSMMGYVFVAFVLVVVGIYFASYNLNAYPLIGYTLYNVTFLFLILVPILTMRSIAEEQRNKTDQLLSADFKAVWNCKYVNVLFGNSWIFSAWLYLYCNWNVCFFHYRKPDYCSSDFFCSFDGFLSNGGDCLLFFRYCNNFSSCIFYSVSSCLYWIWTSSKECSNASCFVCTSRGSTFCVLFDKSDTV